MNAFDIQISKLMIQENGRKEDGEFGHSILMSRLNTPTPGVIALEIIKKLEVKDGIEVEVGQTVSDSRLFYSNIDVPTTLDIMITDVQKKSVLEKMILKALGAASKAGVKIATGGLGTILSASTGSLGGSIIEKFFNSNDKTQKIGVATFELRPDSEDIELTATLVFGEDVSINTHWKKTDHNKRVVNKTKFKKGSNNGEVTILVRKVPM